MSVESKYMVVRTITHLAYTPVKSTALTEVQSAYVTPKGIRGDREWVIVQAKQDENGIHRWISQRDRRNLQDAIQSLGIVVLIQSKVTKDSLILKYPDSDPIEISNSIHTGKKLTIQIWKDVIEGTVDQGDDVAKWLSERLNHSVRLVKIVNSITRPVSSKYLENTHKLQGQDSYPLHWITEESVAELSKRAGKNIPWTRFRPNIVVAGVPTPDFEHTFFHGSFGKVPVVNAKPCDRCPVPLIDQETGIRVLDQEPLKTLSTYKRWKKPSGKIAIIFGEMTLPLGTGKIAVGDTVSVQDYRDPPLQYGA